MSGLLVKSTLIMRENLVELNERALADIPVLLGGAALTRTYVERDLREVYDGRLFYGKRRLRGPAHHGPPGGADAAGEDDPDFGRGISEKNVPASASRAATPGHDARCEGQPARSPEVARDNPLFTPPFVGSRVAKGIPLDEIAAVPQPDRALPQPVGLPARGRRERRRRSRTGCGPSCATQLAKAKEADLLVPPGGLGPLRRQRRGQRPRHLEGRERATRSGCASPSRASARSRGCASPTSSARSSSGERGLRQLHAGAPWVRGSPRRRRGCSPRTSTRDYLFLHGLGVEMAEATAEYWHRRIREELGFADEDGPTPDRPVPPEVPRAAATRGATRPARTSTDNAKVVELLGGGPHRRRGERGVPAPPRADHRRHHLPPPEAKYFVA